MKRIIWLSLAAFFMAALAACSTSAPAAPKEAAIPEASGDLRMQSVLLPGHSEPTEVTYEVRNGEAIFEGDIILGQVDAEGYLLDDGLEDGLSPQGFISNSTLWVNVPFKIADNVSNEGKEQIEAAIKEWESKTPVFFREHSGQKDYVEFVVGDDEEACYSNIGRIGGRQTIKLQPDGTCGSVGVLVHEIGHTLGMLHEHSRPDRDDHITINLENIKEGREHAFKKLKGDVQGGYDYGSIMHYGAKAFCKKDASDTCVGDTITSKGGAIGQRESLSSGDVDTFNALHGLNEYRGHSNTFDCDAPVVCKLGDMNNDGYDDLIQFLRSSKTDYRKGDVLVAKGSSRGFAIPYKAHAMFCVENQRCEVADVDKDGDADLVVFTNTSASPGYTGQLRVALSDGLKFGTPKTWTTKFCMQAQETCLTGDFNGDDHDDIITFHNGAWGGSSQVYVYPSDGESFYYPGKPWHTDFCRKGEMCMVANVNGDRYDDIISFNRNGEVRIAISNGLGFGSAKEAHDDIDCFDDFAFCEMADMNGDKKADILAFTKAPHGKWVYQPQVGMVWDECSASEECADVYVAFSRTFTFGDLYKAHDQLHTSASDQVMVGQLNGSGGSDLVTIRSSGHRVFRSKMK